MPKLYFLFVSIHPKTRLTKIMELIGKGQRDDHWTVAEPESGIEELHAVDNKYFLLGYSGQQFPDSQVTRPSPTCLFYAFCLAFLYIQRQDNAKQWNLYGQRQGCDHCTVAESESGMKTVGRKYGTGSMVTRCSFKLNKEALFSTMSPEAFNLEATSTAFWNSEAAPPPEYSTKLHMRILLRTRVTLKGVAFWQ